jgi:hypothetical protein
LVAITNMKNKIVFKKKLFGREQHHRKEINMSNLSKGVYAVAVYFNEQDKQILNFIKL